MISDKLVVVADSSSAQFLSAKGRKLHDIVGSLDNQDLNTLKVHGRKEGRNGGGHFYDPRVESSELEHHAFAYTIAAEVVKQMKGGDYNSIILVAPPKMLGWLRKKIDSIEIDKSIPLEATQMDKAELEGKIFS
jgi:protein required for attachment to host cells